MRDASSLSVGRRRFGVMRKVAIIASFVFLIISVGFAFYLYLERVNFQGHGRLAFPLKPGDEITFWVSIPAGSYAIASVVGGPNESFASRVDVEGIEVLIEQGGKEIFNGMLNHGVLNRSQRITIAGYQKGLVKIHVYYAESGADTVFIILGQPL